MIVFAGFSCNFHLKSNCTVVNNHKYTQCAEKTPCTLLLLQCKRDNVFFGLYVPVNVVFCSEIHSPHFLLCIRVKNSHGRGTYITHPLIRILESANFAKQLRPVYAKKEFCIGHSLVTSRLLVH